MITHMFCCSSKPTEAPPTSYQPTTTKATIELEGSNSESGHGELEGSGEEEEEDAGKTRHPACDEELIINLQCKVFIVMVSTTCSSVWAFPLSSIYNHLPCCTFEFYY